jgi:hypothetical protein
MMEKFNKLNNSESESFVDSNLITIPQFAPLTRGVEEIQKKSQSRHHTWSSMYT